MTSQLPTAQLRDAVWELVETAQETGVGVAFIPDRDGWTLSYVLPFDWPAYEEYEMGGGPLSSAYDLATAARAAVRPLREMGARVDWYLRSKDA